MSESTRYDEVIEAGERCVLLLRGLADGRARRIVGFRESVWLRDLRVASIDLFRAQWRGKLGGPNRNKPAPIQDGERCLSDLAARLCFRLNPAIVFQAETLINPPPPERLVDALELADLFVTIVGWLRSSTNGESQAVGPQCEAADGSEDEPPTRVKRAWG